ncbi:Ig-like domain-containing protein [Streptococcus parasanguinis]|uniref:Ig-like domain-containing protein n=1 Tax=Streptococcus parasanguinis TaxID=1318 RepID=UPI00021BD4A8|nr:Ig-like domain-containing protein [Streptococcus parasanguinis]EGU63442.1 LPXTG-motif cell wall anchor domain protein [Streptococcus parasanguinis SK236]
MKQKTRNIKIFSFVLCLVAMLFALGLNRTSAETPGVTVSGKLVDTIKNIKVTNNEGGNLDWELGQWATFRINAEFDLAGKDVKAGDTTDITVPDALIITSQSFDIKTTTKPEQVIAHATVDKDNKKISLTYTDYAEKHSDTHGNFYFYARIDFKKHPQQGEIPVEMTVNNKTTIAGKVTFKGVGDGNPNLLKKTSWVHSDDPKTISYGISVNQLKQNIKNVTVEDNLQFTNASYVKDSFRVTKGEMSYVDGEWQFNNTKDVTNEHPITVGENGQSFVVNLGDISETDQYRITYDVHLNYSPADGEVLNNQATLKGKNIKTKEAVNRAAVQIAGGSGVGYVFTIHIHKVDDANQPLAGAKFKVVRQANNQVIGEYVTDKDGNITVNGLLKDKYILTETEAPTGYTIKIAETVVNAEDFGEDHKVTKTIINPKEQTTTTTTTTTTTEEPTTTSTTTTEEPTTTSTTTTEEPTTTSTTTTEEPTTTSTTTTTEEPTTTSTTTTEEPTTTSTTTTEEPTTTSTTTTEEPTTTSTTTTEEPTTTSTTTTEEPTTTSTTTTEEPTTTSTTTTEEPTTTSTTTTEEPTTTSTTTTEEPTTTSTTTTEEPTTTSTTTTEEPTTTSTTTTEEPTTTSTTTTTPEKPEVPRVPGDGEGKWRPRTKSSTTTTPETPTNSSEETSTPENGRGHKTLLPSTGEVVATGLVFSGVLVLSGAVILKRKISNN